MKKNIKKIMTLVLIFAVFFGLTNVVHAELTSTSKGTIDVSGVNENVKVSVYRLMDVHYDNDAKQPIDPIFTWLDAVQPWIESNYPQFKKAADFNTDYMEEHPNFDVAEFYDRLAAAIRTEGEGGIALTPEGTRENAGTIENLTMGNYLILIENGLKVYKPSAVNLIPTWDDTNKAWVMTTPATVEIKSSNPTIEKKSNDKVAVTNKIGGTIPFTILSDVPAFPKNSINKVYNITDELPNGLTLDNASIEVFGLKASNEEEKLVASTNYTLTPTTNGFKVVFDYDSLHDTDNNTYAKVKIVYNASVNENAVIGAANKNKAILEYTNNPYSTEIATSTSDTDVYTYGLKVQKIGDKAEHAAGLPGAEFLLNNSSENKDSPISFVKEQNGVYRVALATDANTVTILTTDDSGNLTVKGLNLGTYYLWETKAPGGYNKPSKPFTVAVVDTDLDGKPEYTDESDATVEDSHGYVPLTVKNTSGFLLPATGGIGTIIFTALGIILMGAGVIAFIKSRKQL